MKKHYETHVEDTDKLIRVAGPVLDYKSWYEQYRKLMEEQAQRKYGLYTPTSEGDDDFPSITGMIARYSALGLTNEQMTENPVWKDLTGNGHDLQMKNFAWGGMSGVGGYGDENYQTFYKFTLDDYALMASPPGVEHMNFTFRVTGLQPGNKLILTFFGTTNTAYGTWDKDGIYTVDADIVEAGKPTYFYNGYGATRGEFTIEILPLYPGALVFDGVDDYGVCDNFPILTKEKGYTVVALRQWLSFQDIGYPTLVVNSTDRLAAFSFEDFRSKTKSTWNWGRSVGLSDYKIPLLYTYQTSTSYNSKTIYAGATEEGSNILQVCRSGIYCANAAIWEIVILDHDATEEELTKIKDYFVKTYPWLFPDQAWTVTGKTNEDEDRATIANITGNSNDLVLSNFGFIEGSGYNEEGEHAGYLVTDGVDDKITSSIFEMGNDWTVIGDWELINTGKNDNAGIVKFNSIVIYNYNPILINIKNGRNNLIPDQNTVNAICSDGRIYSKDWKEYIYNEETESTSKNLLTIGYSGNRYTKIAFKNLAIYPTILSKEDCIKAYNYLQTLKSK